jgi:hypothetical protein
MQVKSSRVILLTYILILSPLLCVSRAVYLFQACFERVKSSMRYTSPPCVLHASPTNLYLIWLCKYMLWRVHITYFIIMPYYPTRCYSLCSPQHHVLNHSSAVFHFQCDTQSFVTVCGHSSNCDRASIIQVKVGYKSEYDINQSMIQIMVRYQSII